MTLVYVVIMQTWDAKDVANIFNSRKKAEEYVEKMKPTFPNTHWSVDCWEVH